jgi:hypothetical protein
LTAQQFQETQKKYITLFSQIEIDTKTNKHFVEALQSSIYFGEREHSHWNNLLTKNKTTQTPQKYSCYPKTSDRTNVSISQKPSLRV